jgi:hypothetical protein
MPVWSEIFQTLPLPGLNREEFLNQVEGTGSCMPATKIVVGVGGGDDVCADAGRQEECVYTKGTA